MDAVASGMNSPANYTCGSNPSYQLQFGNDNAMLQCFQEPFGEFINTLTPPNIDQGHQQNGLMDTFVPGDFDIEQFLDNPLPTPSVSNDPGSTYIDHLNHIGQVTGNPVVCCQPPPEANSLMELLELEPKLLELERVGQESCRLVQHLKTEVQQLQDHLRDQLHIIDTFDRTGLSQQHLEFLATQKRDSIIQKEKTILEKYWSSIVNLQNLLSKVLDDGIMEYQRDAAYKNCGKPVSEYLTIKKLQEWVKRLAKLVSSNLQQMDKLLRLEQLLGLDSQPQPSTQIIEELKGNYLSMIKSLVEKGLVVERHPPQVLMKGRRFQSGLRHLIGDALDIDKISFKVDAYLINDKQVVNVLQQGPTSTFDWIGNIKDSSGYSDYNSQTGLLSVNMRTMCLNDMPQRGTQRTGTAGTETVAQQKFAMLFRAKITVGYLSHPVDAQTLSLPIVVTSHGKQDADAQATIFWDNAFADINRKPFEVINSVPWSEMLEALDARWKVECRESSQNAVGLLPKAKKYLSARLFGRDEVPPETMITWNKFNSDKMIMRGSADQRHPFTFWTWFYKAMELCSCKYIKEFWNRKLIHGFLSKKDCRDMLQKRQPGTFMFRFSETQLGAVSISYTTVKKNDVSGFQVQHFVPDTKDEFEKKKNLPDMVLELKVLHYLCQVGQKDQVFAKEKAVRKKKAAVPQNPHDPYKEKHLVTSTMGDDVEQCTFSEFPSSSHVAGVPIEHGFMDEALIENKMDLDFAA